MLESQFLGLSLEALKSNFSRLQKPYKLNFAITMKCQSRCLTCNIWELRPKDELSIDEIRDFAKKNNYFKWIGITGGEPFLRGDIVDIVKAFKENCPGLYLLTIPTNSLCGQSMVAAKVRQMLELGIPKVVITLSLDGDRETHDRIRGINGNYDKVMGMYHALEDVRRDYPNLSVVFGYTISRTNQGMLQRTYESVKREIPSITYDDFHLNLAQLSNNYYRNSGNAIIADGDIASAELEHALEGRHKNLKPMSFVESTFLRGLIRFAKTGKAPESCRSLDASLFMDNMGNIYPSIMWDRKLANIREINYDLKGVWENKDANEMRELIRDAKDPVHWTSCEAYQSILGNLFSIWKLRAGAHETTTRESVGSKERESVTVQNVDQPAQVSTSRERSTNK